MRYKPVRALTLYIIRPSSTYDGERITSCGPKKVPVPGKTELNDGLILEHLQRIQRSNQIAQSAKLEGRNNGYNLTVEMETGVGKTYTYIKTMEKKVPVPGKKI